MIDKRVLNAADAVRDVSDGAVLLIGGFGEAGNPTELIHALIDQGARELTVVNNNAGNGEIGLARLLQMRRVRKLICSYPRGSHSHVFDALYKAGAIELELIPQGTLAERIRAGGAACSARGHQHAHSQRHHTQRRSAFLGATSHSERTDLDEATRELHYAHSSKWMRFPS